MDKKEEINKAITLSNLVSSLEKLDLTIQKAYSKEWDKKFDWVKPGQLFRTKMDAEGSPIVSGGNGHVILEYKRVYIPFVPKDSIVMFVKTLCGEELSYYLDGKLNFVRSSFGPLWLYEEQMILTKFRLDQLDPLFMDADKTDE